MFRMVMIVGLMTTLAACATLDESECLNANWYDIGFVDGTNGKPLSHFSRHIKACTKHGVSPDQTPWREGREQGLRVFCVPERAYKIGRSGSSFPAVCTPQESIEMRPAYDWGRNYHDLSDRIAELEADIDDREDELDELTDPDDPLFDLYNLYNFRDRSEIRRLERRRQPYEFWPG